MESPRARQAVADYNRLSAEMTDLETLRLRAEDGAPGGGRSICASCHGERKLTTGPLDGAPLSESSGQAVRIHQRAGLLAMRVAEIDESLDGLRVELREMRLTAARGASGALRFYPEDPVPRGVTRVGGVWRLKVGAGKLDESKLTLTGGGSVVGKVPSGLPGISIPEVDWNTTPRLLRRDHRAARLHGGHLDRQGDGRAQAASRLQTRAIGQGLSNLTACRQGYLFRLVLPPAVNSPAARPAPSNVIASAVVGSLLC